MIYQNVQKINAFSGRSENKVLTLMDKNPILKLSNTMPTVLELSGADGRVIKVVTKTVHYGCTLMDTTKSYYKGVYQ